MPSKRKIIPNRLIFFKKKGLEIITFFLLIFVPLVFCRPCDDMFFPVKEFVFESLVLAAFLLWVYYWLEGSFFNLKMPALHLTILDVLLFLLIFWAVASLFWAQSLWVTIKELPLFLAGPVLYFIVAHPFSDKNPIRSEKIILILIVIGSLWGLYGILQYFGLDLFFDTPQTGRTYRVMGVMGNVNYFAEYLVGIIPVGISFLLAAGKTSKRMFILSGILIMIICLIFTFTRSAYLGFSAALAFIALFFPLLQRRNIIRINKKMILIALILILLATIIFMFPNPLNKPGSVIHTIKNRLSLDTLRKELYSGRRRAIWSFTSMMIQDRSMFGSGLGTFPYLSLDYQAQFFQQGNNRDIYQHGYAKQVHNEYLQLGAELGLVGLVLLIAVMITFFVFVIKGLESITDHKKITLVIGMMAGIVAILFDGIFGFPFHLPATLVIFWLYMGISVTIIRQGVINEEPQQNNSGEQNNQKKNLQIRSEVKKYLNKKRIFLPLLLFGMLIIFSINLARPLMSNYYLGEANREVRSQNIQPAIELYKRALEVDPYNGRASYSIGKLMTMQKKYEKALEYFMMAEKTYNTHHLPMDMAVVFFRQGLYEEAVEKFKQAISYQTDTKSMAPIYTDLGSTYLKLGMFELAEEAYLKALKKNPEFGYASYRLALLYLQQGEQEQAIPYLQRVIRVMPDTQEANNAQNILLQLNQPNNISENINK